MNTNDLFWTIINESGPDCCNIDSIIKNYIKKYFISIVSFFVIVISEILVRYSGFSYLFALTYIIFPVALSFLMYLTLLFISKNEKI